MSPSQVGPYIIERKIGAGGMGTVYQARHEETDKIAAVKVLPASLAREEGFVARFSREVEALKKLSNPYIVQLYESGMDGETYYYAMEYVEGETLTNRLRREKRIPWQEVISLSVQICSALKAAHDTGIVHRDLKPSNLLITPEGNVKLTDFGVAQLFAASQLTVTGGIIGTAEYMSPEQAQGQRATKKSDLYSLGAVIYVMLTGRPPFSGKTSLDVMHKHRYSQFDRPRLVVPEIPHWLDELVCQLLEKDPDKRLPNAYVLSRRLQEVVKKVELSREEETFAMGPAEDADSSPTMAMDKPQSGPGPGTLMHHFMRAELENQEKETRLGSFLNNTWVLVGLLILLIAGGVLWFQSLELSPQERFETGVALLEESEGREWRLVRDEYFAPLLNSNSKKWEERLAPHMEKIELYELRSRLDLDGKISKRNRPQSEAERLLLLAQHYRETGDLGRAEEILLALQSLLKNTGKEETLYRLTGELLEQVRQRREKGSNQQEWLKDSLKRAEKLASEGREKEAREIWAGIVKLYESDPRAEDFVRRARRRLNDQKLISKETTEQP